MEEWVDIDNIEIELVAGENDDLALRIRPRLYEAIREAEAFQGPVGQGIAEMTDVRGFYGRLAGAIQHRGTLRVADPMASLKSKDANERVLTAGMLIYRYRDCRKNPNGKAKEEPIDAAQSKLILTAIAEGDWNQPLT